MSPEQNISTELALRTLAKEPLSFPTVIEDFDEAAAILFLEQMAKRGLCKQVRANGSLTYEITEAGRAALANR